MPTPLAPEITTWPDGPVQLGDTIRVEGRLTDNDPQRLEFGMAVELTMITLDTVDGDDILAFAFRPL